MAGMFYEIMPGYGYCLNIDDAHNTVRVYQEQTRNRYCSTVKTLQFGLIDVAAKTRKIHWEDDQRGKVTRECLLYDGVPFHILGKKVFYCEFGRNRNVKRVNKTFTNEKGNSTTKPTTTKKVDCPALIYMKEVMKYPAYMIDENSSAARTKMAERLKSDICEGKARGERRFYIVFPNIKEHRNHAVFYLRCQVVSMKSRMAKPNTCQNTRFKFLMVNVFIYGDTRDLAARLFHTSSVAVNVPPIRYLFSVAQESSIKSNKDGKLVRVEEIHCPDDSLSQDSIMVPTKQVLSKPSNAQLCREVIDELERMINSQSANQMLLREAETMLKDAVEFFTSNPILSSCLSS